MPEFDYGEKLKDGQYEHHPILSEYERKKGFIRPLRFSYKHKSCGALTSMGREIAECYATEPTYYTHTFCATCGDYFPVNEFTWKDTNEDVGS